MYRDFCTCSQIINPRDVPPPACNGDCIFAPHMLLYGDLAPDMCGITQSVIWDEACLDDCGCGDDSPSFRLDEYTENLTDVSVDENGITFTTAWVEGMSQVATVSYIMYCNQLSSIGTLTIVMNNPCINVVCSEGYECNKCTGGCVSTLDLDVRLL